MLDWLYFFIQLWNEGRSTASFIEHLLMSPKMLIDISKSFSSAFISKHATSQALGDWSTECPEVLGGHLKPTALCSHLPETGLGKCWLMDAAFNLCMPGGEA